MLDSGLLMLVLDLSVEYLQLIPKHGAVRAHLASLIPHQSSLCLGLILFPCPSSTA